MYEIPNLLYGFLTKYYGSLNNPSRGDFHGQIFARDCNESGETQQEVPKIINFSVRISHCLKLKSPV